MNGESLRGKPHPTRARRVAWGPPQHTSDARPWLRVAVQRGDNAGYESECRGV